MPPTPDSASEAEYLAQYNLHDYEVPLATVDLCIFTLHEGALKILLIRRGDYPQKGTWALPGGFVDVTRDADLHATALRKLQEKTGVEAPYLEQLATLGNRTRDPRGWSLTVVYFALIPFVALSPQDSEAVIWASVAEPRSLAFDHTQLLAMALNRLRSKVLYTLMPAHLIPTPFTLSALQRAYEIVLGREVEKKAFRRRLENADVVVATGEMVTEGLGRPAALYRLKEGLSAFNFSRQLAP